MPARADMIARLLADADRLEAEGDAALDRGDAEAARRLLDRAIVRREAAEVLRAGNDSGITSDVTKSQKRRGLAIARGKAADRKRGGDIAQAIAADPRWGSITAYAKKRLHISQPALSRYLSGDLDVPPEVRAAVAADFQLTDWPPRRK